MGIILKPFAWLLLFFYNLLDSYGMALILFAIVVKTILFPVTLKSKKSMIKTTMLSNKAQQLQKQFGKDKDRYNMELQKLYQREHVNPMSGCLWSLIPMVLLIALYAVVRQPLTYFMDLTAAQVDQLATALDFEHVAVAQGWVSARQMADALAKIAEDPARSLVASTGAFNQLHLLSMITESNLAELSALVKSDKLFVMNTQFLGINMDAIPQWRIWKSTLNWNSIGLFLIPIISVAASWVSMKVSMATNAINQGDQKGQADQTNKVMMWMMPLMSLWIGFTVPAGLSIYWIAQYIIQAVQEIISAKMLKKDYEEARRATEERERREKEEEKKRKEEARLERARRAEEEKKNHGKKKAHREEAEQSGVNKDDSREGLRAYARGRAYIPDRFGGVTPYRDSSDLLCSMIAAANRPVEKKKKNKKNTPEEAPEKETAPVKAETPAMEAPAEEKVPAEKKTSAAETPAETPAAETSAEMKAPAETETPTEEKQTEASGEDQEKEV